MTYAAVSAWRASACVLHACVLQRTRHQLVIQRVCMYVLPVDMLYAGACSAGISTQFLTHPRVECCFQVLQNF
jgi:hypothetical protein